jgi:hypothetical protein
VGRPTRAGGFKIMALIAEGIPGSGRNGNSILGNGERWLLAIFADFNPTLDRFGHNPSLLFVQVRATLFLASLGFGHASFSRATKRVMDPKEAAELAAFFRGEDVPEMGKDAVAASNSIEAYFIKAVTHTVGSKRETSTHKWAFAHSVLHTIFVSFTAHDPQNRPKVIDRGKDTKREQIFAILCVKFFSTWYSPRNVFLPRISRNCNRCNPTLNSKHWKTFLTSLPRNST